MTSSVYSVQSLSGVSATASVPAVLDNGIPHASHSLVVTTSAGVSGGVVTLQGSHDGTNWFSTAGTVTTNAASTVFAVAVANFPYQFVQAKITTVISGGTISATVQSA